MPMPSRSKSVGGFGRSDRAPLTTSNINVDDHASNCTSHLANLRSISRGKLIKPSSADRRSSGRHVHDIRNMVWDSGSDVKHAVSHDSVDLLSSRPVIPPPSRRKTIAGNVPFTIEEKEEEEENSLALPSLTTPLHHAASENQPFSPQVLGGLQYKTSASGRRPFKSRNSIDNADVSQNKPIRKLTLEPTREDSREGQADRIRVYVRVRPMSSKEKETGARCCVRAANKREIYLTEIALETDYLRLKRLKGRYFAFDGAFPDDTGQEEIYRASTAQLVEGVLEGRNSSVFCYGATGAGKTFTMLGTVNNPGVMVLALRDLFSKLKQRSKEGEHVVRLSYLEVYNESVRDLLSPGRPLVIREDAKQGIVASGLTQYQAVSADEVMALLQQGNQNRTTEPTRLNETSSRSHAILQVVVEYHARVDACLVTRTGKLSLIDLAGSERAIATDQRTLRSLEGANINRSLLALSSCISALVEGKKHIPFRNSKLTQLLKDSLGGACQTAMIANISPSNLSFGETQNTLYWADRAKEIRTKVSVANEELQVPTSQSEQLQLLLQVQKENQQLRMQVAQLQQKLLELENDALALPPAGQQCNDVCVPSVRLPQKENVEGTDQHGRHEEVMMRTPLTHSAVKRKILMRSPLPPPRDSAFGFRSTTRDHSGRKRTFWDITNTSSPSGKQTGRNTRSNTAAEATPSLLLQPGFLRGRPSFN